MEEGEQPFRDFRALYRAHYGFVWHALHRFGIDWAALDDACQDVFVVAYRRRHDFRGDSARAWLYGIARRVASNDRRSRDRRRRREAVVAERASREGARELIVALDDYLSRLRPEDRELFILSEIEGMTGPEIAEARNRNLATVYTRIRKLRHDFRADLEDLPSVRQARPRATAQGWALLMPLLPPPPVGLVILGTKVSWGGLFGVAGASIATAALVAVVSAAPPPAREVGVVPAEATPESHGQRHTSPPVLSNGTAPEGRSTTPTRPDDRKKSRPKARERDSDSGEAAPNPSSNLALENELLHRAAERLRANDAAEALNLTRAHDERFPGSAFADLRTALRIEALCALGQHDTARAESRSFPLDHPGSPFVERIERGCGSPQ